MKDVFIRQNSQSLCRGNFVIGAGENPFIAPCALGHGGLTAFKREGDGGTPLGVFDAMKVYYRPDRVPRPRTQLPVIAISPSMGWCDAPDDRNYNRPVHLPYPACHETLIRGDHLYDYVVVLDYNISCRKRGAGSAIFFHLAHNDFRPTEGCVAVSRPVMERFFAWANRDTSFVIER